MRRRLCSVLLLVFLLLTPSVTFSQSPPPDAAIGIIMDGPWDRNEEVLELFRNEIYDLLKGEFEIRFPSDKTVTADFTMDGIRSSLEHMLADKDVDLIITLGPLVSTVALMADPMSKPVVAPFVVGEWLTGVELQYGASGIRNLMVPCVTLKSSLLSSAAANCSSHLS